MRGGKLYMHIYVLFSIVLIVLCLLISFCFFFQAEDGIRDLVRSRGLGDVYKRQQQRRASVILDEEYDNAPRYHVCQFGE